MKAEEVRGAELEELLAEAYRHPGAAELAAALRRLSVAPENADVRLWLRDPPVVEQLIAQYDAREAG